MIKAKTISPRKNQKLRIRMDLQGGGGLSLTSHDIPDTSAGFAPKCLVDRNSVLPDIQYSLLRHLRDRLSNTVTAATCGNRGLDM